MVTLTRSLNNIKSGILVLDRETSIVLPEFDTTSIAKSDISEITLSLFLSDTSFTGIKKIHLTINPFNPKTGEINDGLSIVIDSKKGHYINLRLPRELFEKIVRSSKKLLLMLVDNNIKLTFEVFDNRGINNDPRLTVTYSDGTTDQENPPIINYNFSQVNIVGSDQKIDIQVNDKESFVKKFFWYVIVGIFVAVVAAIISNKLLGL